MTNQWPQARSLKDDPPPIGAVVLLYHSVCRSWHRSPLSDSDAERFGGGPDEVWTHWLPMPPDPPQPKQAWEDQWNRFRGEEQPGYLPPPEKDCFKAGWNAALEQVCTFRGFNLNSEQYVLWEQFLNKIKAP